MATLGLGSMVVQLDLDGADFIRNTGQARQALGQMPREIDRTSNALNINRGAARLAARGLGELTGISGQVIFGFEQMTEKALAASGAIGLLGKAGIALGAFTGAFLIGQGLGDELRNLRDFGELSSATVERLRKDNEEQKKWAAERQAAGRSALALQKDQVAAETDLAVLRAKIADDDVGAAEESLRGKLRTLDIEHKERRDTIVATVKSEWGQSAQLIAAAKLTADKRVVLMAGAADKIQEIQKAQLLKTQATYLEETQLFVQQIKARITAEQSLRAATTAALSRQPQIPKFGWTQGAPVATGTDAFGLGAGSTFIPRQFEQIGVQSAGLLAGLEKVRELKGDMATFAVPLAKAGEEGATADDIWREMTLTEAGLLERSRALKQEFADTPGVLNVLNQAMGKVEFGGFRTLVDQAKNALAAMGQETSVEAMLARLQELLTTGVPAGVNAAIPELDKLKLSMAGLRSEINATSGSVGVLIQNLAGAQAQAVVPVGGGGIQVFEEGQ